MGPTLVNYVYDRLSVNIRLSFPALGNALGGKCTLDRLGSLLVTDVGDRLCR